VSVEQRSRSKLTPKSATKGSSSSLCSSRRRQAYVAAKVAGAEPACRKAIGRAEASEGGLDSVGFRSSKRAGFSRNNLVPLV
jgi:hypothetical protein